MLSTWLSSVFHESKIEALYVPRALLMNMLNSKRPFRRLQRLCVRVGNPRLVQGELLVTTHPAGPRSSGESLASASPSYGSHPQKVTVNTLLPARLHQIANCRMETS